MTTTNNASPATTNSENAEDLDCQPSASAAISFQSMAVSSVLVSKPKQKKSPLDFDLVSSNCSNIAVVVVVRAAIVAV